MNSDPIERLAREVIRTFRARGYVYNRPDMCSLLLGQVAEMIQHAARGEDERYRNELADVISIAYQALLVEGKRPGKLVVRRIVRKVLPKARDGTISAKYRLQERPRA